MRERYATSGALGEDSREIDLPDDGVTDADGQAIADDSGFGVALGEAPNLDCFAQRIDDPVLGDAVTAVELAFEVPVPCRGAWRQDLDDEVGRASKPVLPDDVQSLVQRDTQGY